MDYPTSNLYPKIFIFLIYAEIFPYIILVIKLFIFQCKCSKTINYNASLKSFCGEKQPKNKIEYFNNNNILKYLPCRIIFSLEDDDIHKVKERIRCRMSLILCKTDEVNKRNGIWDSGIEYLQIYVTKFKIDAQTKFIIIYGTFSHEKQHTFKNWKNGTTAFTVFTLPNKYVSNALKYAIKGLANNQESRDKIFPVSISK